MVRVRAARSVRSVARTRGGTSSGQLENDALRGPLDSPHRKRVSTLGTLRTFT